MNAKHALRFVSSLVILTAAAANAADKEAADKDLKTLVKGAKDYQVVYSVNLLKKDLMKGGKATNYDTDNSAKITGKIAKVGYALILNGKDYAFVSMDPFTDDVKKIGVPDKASGARFQAKIKNLTVESNVKGVENGTFPEGGNIEFWDCNYSTKNAAKVPGASDKTFDFGDIMSTKASPGYGSMQVHNYSKKQTVLAFNNFRSGSRDIGIGNRPTSHPDWTFAKNSSKYKSAKLYVLVKTK
jgi:sialate O-acetylesterase